jgi:hypothetical protein
VVSRQPRFVTGTHPPDRWLLPFGSPSYAEGISDFPRLDRAHLRYGILPRLFAGPAFTTGEYSTPPRPARVRTQSHGTRTTANARSSYKGVTRCNCGLPRCTRRLVGDYSTYSESRPCPTRFFQLIQHRGRGSALGYPMAFRPALYGLGDASSPFPGGPWVVE